MGGERELAYGRCTIDMARKTVRKEMDKPSTYAAKANNSGIVQASSNMIVPLPVSFQRLE